MTYVPVARRHDDDVLVRSVLEGDDSAAGILHDRIRPQIERTLRRLVGRHDVEHDDLVQRSLIEVIRSLPRFRGDCALETWASKIAAHLVFKELRHRRAVRRVFDPSEPDAAVAACGDLDRDTAARVALERVRGHLDAMSPERSWTLVLTEVCGYGMREVADITESSIPAAQSRLLRARRELQERVAADPVLRDLLDELWEGRP